MRQRQCQHRHRAAHRSGPSILADHFKHGIMPGSDRRQPGRGPCVKPVGKRQDHRLFDRHAFICHNRRIRHCAERFDPQQRLPPRHRALPHRR
jgi:hypothetical protein